jgi:hypothetical protein
MILLTNRDNGNAVLWLQIDNCSVEVAKCKHLNDVVISRKTWEGGSRHTGPGHWATTSTHYLSPGQKGTQSSLSALDMIVQSHITFETLKNKDFKLKRVYVVSDGGPADYLMTEFQANMWKWASQNDFKLEHVILCPYHG